MKKHKVDINRYRTVLRGLDVDRAAAAQCVEGLAAYESDLHAIAATAERDALSTNGRLRP